MQHDFYQTAIAVRSTISKEDPRYALKADILAQILASFFKNEEQEFTELRIKYNLSEFSSIPTPFVIDIIKEFLDALSIKMEYTETKTNFAYREVIIFRK